MIAVYKRELKSFFSGMLTYVYFAIYALFSGIFSVVFNLYGGYSNYGVILSYLVLVLLISTPILTMRTLAEERRSKTDILLTSLPIKTSDYVLGKYFALVTVTAIPMLASCIMPIILDAYCEGSVNYLMTYGSLLAFFLCSCALTAIGLFMSSLTDNIVIAALLSFAAMLVIYFLPAIALLLPQTVTGSAIALAVLVIILSLLVYFASKSLTASIITAAFLGTLLVGVLIFKKTLFEGALYRVISSLSLTDKLESFISGGVFDISSVVYFISVAALFVFFAQQSCDRRRFA